MYKHNLPLKLKPQFETELIRLGKNNDGGYLISKKSLNSSNKLYSFGLDDDYSFEKDFFKKTKIDIEGSEYRILSQLIKHSSHISGLVIEFHDCDLNLDKIINFVENFELQIVHIHVNNWSYISSSGLPQCLEISFSPSKFNTEIKEEKKYPIELDQPNNPQYEDLPIEFT